MRKDKNNQIIKIRVIKSALKKTYVRQLTSIEEVVYYRYIKDKKEIKNMEKSKKQITKISLLIVGVFALVTGLSYAFINLTLQGTKRQVIEAGTLSLQLLEDNNNISIQNALPMYDDVGMIQDPFTFRLINKGTTSANYKVKLVEIGTGTLSKSDVKYGLTKDGVKTIGLLSDIKEGVIDSGVIGASPETIEYSLRLWIKDTVTDNEMISGKSLSYRVDVEVGQIVEEEPGEVVTDTLFETENLGTNCTTYNDGVDTFLVGQCSNNYVWYSGKLWRIVLKNNETGAVKMVTDNAITAIPYNAEGNTAFKDSYMDQWLNQEFLPTLHDYEDYLVTNSIWDATADSSSEPARPAGTTTVERTVGLLNAYEYYTTYTQSGGLATSSTTYLNNGVYWWLLTPYNASDVRTVYNNSSLYYYNPSNGAGARPSVNLKSTVQIDSGSGTQSYPYILKGDVQETVAGTTLLSTRYSGEYVTFNNELYRIVGVENGLTKITAVDKPSGLASNAFDSSTTNFANASIKTDLETYYQGLQTANETAFKMIEPNTTWYLGGVGSGSSFGNHHYKASICATVDAGVSMSACDEKATSTTASIALPRAGEMFTSHITRGSKASFWTLTPYSPLYVWYVYNYGTLLNNFPTSGYGARPSMYLKSNVVIASNNTGNGTYEYPYSLEISS